MGAKITFNENWMKPNNLKTNAKPSWTKSNQIVFTNHIVGANTTYSTIQMSAANIKCAKIKQKQHSQNTHAKIITCNITALISIQSPVLLRIVNRLSINKNRISSLCFWQCGWALKLHNRSYASMEQLKWFETCSEKLLLLLSYGLKFPTTTKIKTIFYFSIIIFIKRMKSIDREFQTDLNTSVVLFLYSMCDDH